jgi:alkyl sulfatase BDS1-like metallo-beta-lactamase superfamily hydrolase
MLIEENCTVRSNYLHYLNSGTLGWSVKGVYEQYVGCFSGDPVDLKAHTPVERARLMVDMIGEDQLLAYAETALEKKQIQWALELASHLFRAQPNNPKAKVR